MAVIEEIRTHAALAVGAARAAAQERGDHPTLRCSSLGEECERRLWYTFRWAHEPETHDARTLLIFKMGHVIESMVIESWQATDMVVSATQGEVSFVYGHLTGHVDAVLDNVPDAPKTTHLGEIKSMKDERYRNWRRKGVKESDPKYYAQIQLYMHGLSLTRTLFWVVNKNTQEEDAERIHYDAATAIALLAKAERVAFAERPPTKISDKPDYYACRFCPAHAQCQLAAWSRSHCRTCLHASPTRQGGWVCARFDKFLTPQEQADGCPAHLFIPDLVPGEQIDADEAAETVTYRLRDGSTWVDAAGTVRAA